ncbi:SEC-C domain-containing protein [Pseudoalteromonas galatheae]|uniref:SEC-C domain-containing protein n=1 Tax=Pseudoalteromonas galatheae TaxID=579562 RepID=UPI0014333946|nr:SEC-C domain-containing protein [Pseudoalteromonas galatheae]
MVNSRIGRNDLCWCGSNKKYKKCHLNRDKQEPIKYWEINQAFQKANSRKECLVPKSLSLQCSGNIIKAHTVPKTSSLRAISQDGHVLGYKMTFESMRKHSGTPTFEKIGVNQASTFNGFCKYHDDVLFSSLEKERFAATKKQCFSLSYRAFAKEYYAKSAVLSLSPLRNDADKGKTIQEQIDIQMNNYLFELGTKAAMEDLEYHKAYFDAALEAHDYDNTRAVVFILDEPPPFMVCGSVNPDYDFNGAKLQELMDLDKRSDCISVTSYYDGCKGIVVLSWLENSDVSCQSLMRSLLSKKKELYLPFVVQYIFKYFENVFIAPNWWEKLHTDSKNMLTALTSDNVSTHDEPNSDGLLEVVAKYELPKLAEVQLVGWSL